MRTLTLSTEITPARLRYNKDLYPRDIKGALPTLIAGEWCQLVDEHRKKNYLGYFNIHANDSAPGRIVCELEKLFAADLNEKEIALRFLDKQLSSVFERKQIFKNYHEGFRLSHGASDELSGLVIDVYKNIVLVQINTAGMDRFREEIRTKLRSLFPQHLVHFLDHEIYRRAELLPFYEVDKLDRELEIQENGFLYKISPEVLQKVGFYYDHRENREKLERKIQTCNLVFEKGLDLFCYAGGWGLHLLRSGVKHVTFVDQGNLEKTVLNHVELNGFSGRGNYKRQDVFQYLDEAFARADLFDVIVSDPPAFKKNEKNKNAALSGYEKLHGKALKLLKNKSLFAACSCTHNISHEELDHTVTQAALKEGRKVFMLDLGIQGADHSFSSLSDKNYYLKYILYFVETL